MTRAQAVLTGHIARVALGHIPLSSCNIARCVGTGHVALTMRVGYRLA